MDTIKANQGLATYVVHASPLPPQCVALIRSGGADATVKVEFFDGDGRNLVMVGGSDKGSMIGLTVSTVAKSIAQLLGEAGYCLDQTVPGIPNGAVGGRIWGVTNLFVPNTGGGTAGYAATAEDLTWITGTGTGPDASHPHPYGPGEYFQFGAVS